MNTVTGAAALTDAGKAANSGVPASHWVAREQAPRGSVSRRRDRRAEVIAERKSMRRSVSELRKAATGER